MAIKANELNLMITADTSNVDAAIERISARLGELASLAKEIRAAQPALKDEVDAVLDAIEHMVDVKPDA